MNFKTFLFISAFLFGVLLRIARDRPDLFKRKPKKPPRVEPQRSEPEIVIHYPPSWQRINGKSYQFCNDLLQAPHILIAGATGSGKSVLLNDILYSALLNTPKEMQLILLDPKRVELIQYKSLPHVLMYCNESNSMIRGLQYAVELMMSRYEYMESIGQRKYNGSDVYVIIDEYADLITTDGKKATPLIQRLAQLGRAAKVHLIMCTQAPNRKTLAPNITLNLVDRIALHCTSAIESRQIIGVPGAENLPRFGSALYASPTGIEELNIPLTTDNEINQRVNIWIDQAKRNGV